MSRFGWRRLPKFTGTGFAQPNRNGAFSRNRIPGTSTVPIEIDVLERVERHPSQHPRRLVAEHAGDVAVGGFVQCDRQDHGHCPEHQGLERKIHRRRILPEVGRRRPSGESDACRIARRPRGRSCPGSLARSTTVVGTAGHGPASITRSIRVSRRSRISFGSLSGASAPGRIRVVDRIGSPSSASSARTTGCSGTRMPTVWRFGLLQAPRHLARGRQDERERSRDALPDDAELPVGEAHVAAGVHEVATDERQEMPVAEARGSASIRFAASALPTWQPSA